MFERYTAPARRIIFFARYEASQFGSGAIDTELLLLGMVREGAGRAGAILQGAGVTAAVARMEVI